MARILPGIGINHVRGRAVVGAPVRGHLFPKDIVIKNIKDALVVFPIIHKHRIASKQPYM